MAITSELIGKLGGTDVEVIPVSNATASGAKGSKTVLHTVQVSAGETWLVAVVGTATAENTYVDNYPLMNIGDVVGNLKDVGGVSAVVTRSAEVAFTRQVGYGTDRFTGHVYAVKL